MQFKILIFVGVFLLLFFLNFFLKVKHPFFRTLGSTILYPTLLYFISCIYELTNIPFSFNLITVAVSILTGIPGIITMGILNIYTNTT